MMTFNEAMSTAVLYHDKIRHIDWGDGYYIMLNKAGHIVDECGGVYSIDKEDIMSRWEYYQPKVTVGSLLSYAGNQYRVVLNSDDRLDIVDTKTWKVFIGNIYKDKLDSVVKSYSMNVINNDSIGQEG